MTRMSITSSLPSSSSMDISKIKRSLVISPNLDALLEHEERTRANAINATCSSRSASPSDEFLVGLPPPPRHPPRIKTPRLNSSLKGNLLLSEDTEPQPPETHEKLTLTSIFVQPTSSSTSNPYINPAPTLDELDDNIPNSSVTTESSINSLSQSRPCDHEQPCSDTRNQSTILFTSLAWPPAQYSTSRVPKLRRVSSSLYTDSSVEGRKRQSRTTKSPSSGLHKDSSTQGLNGDAWSNAAINSDTRRRPLFSHARRPSSSPDSTNTVSTVSDSATTIQNDPRNSISRTAVSPPNHSNFHSRTRALYNHPVLSFTKSKQNSDSDLEIYSLSQTDLDLNNTSMDCPQLSPMQFSRLSLSEYSLPLFSSDPTDSKPPLPTTPKPFYSKKPRILRQGFPILTEPPKISAAPLPLTTNFLDVEERADLIRKTRKLTRVFGQTPRADTMPQESSSTTSRYSSVLNDLDWPILGRRRSALEPPLLAIGRRHSEPLSPADMPFVNISPSSQGSSNQAGHHARVQTKSEHLINLSVDTLDEGDIAFVMPEDQTSRSLESSPAQSYFGKLSEEEQVDDDRRRKRERLAKLHRCLGSRIPVNLVLGIDNVDSIPPALRSPTSPSHGITKRKRSSSVVPTSPHWPNDFERVKEELNVKEKFINVRRAVKMEKVFGVAPPQTLYHTRHCSPLPLFTGSHSAPEVSPIESATPLLRNFNHSAHHRKSGRPGTSDSSDSGMQLLPKEQQPDKLANTWGSEHSAIYSHYQCSLNSLNDILDRDDRESLLELHRYLNAGEDLSSPVSFERRLSNASSIISGRRRSLPANPSMISLNSEYSAEVNVTTFQLRRRQAAKLTQFFGVDYRDLINDILQSIENGVEDDHVNGTLREEEVEALLVKLRNLKAQRQNFM